MDPRIAQIADHYGAAQQLIKACEECAELAQAVCKYLNGGSSNINEELEDVQIMIDQLRHYGFGDPAIREAKLNRTMTAIKIRGRRD